MRLLTVLDDAYPMNLRSVHNRPPFVLVLAASSFLRMTARSPSSERGVRARKVSSMQSSSPAGLPRRATRS